MSRTLADTSEDFSIGLGQRIREARHAARMSLDQLAVITCMSKAGLWQIEQGHSSPGAGTLWRLSRALRISIDYMVSGSEPAYLAEGRA